jgi:putative peptidoglycan lipid II flippase
VLYSIGLIGYTGVKVLAPAFYALGTPRVPLAASALAVATNLAVIFLGHGALGFRAIALGTALGSLLNAGWLLVVFQRRLGGLLGQGFFRGILRMAAAAAVMGVLARLAAGALERALGTSGLAAQLTTGLLPVAAGAALYFALTHVLRVGEAHALSSLVFRRAAGR